jgi:hypothetical protein
VCGLATASAHTQGRKGSDAAGGVGCDAAGDGVGGEAAAARSIRRPRKMALMSDLEVSACAVRHSRTDSDENSRISDEEGIRVRDEAHAAVSRHPPIPLSTMVPRTACYTHDVGVRWDSSIVVQGFFVAPCQTKPRFDGFCIACTAGGGAHAGRQRRRCPSAARWCQRRQGFFRTRNNFSGSRHARRARWPPRGSRPGRGETRGKCKSIAELMYPRRGLNA